MELREWSGQNTVNNDMVYKEGSNSSLDEMFKIIELWGGNHSVVSTHNSKSIKLPVIHCINEIGEFYLRDNFYDIKMSFKLSKPVDHDLFGVVAFSDIYLNPCYFEGFKEDWVFSGFHKGKKEFSVCLNWERSFELVKILLAYFGGAETLRVFKYKSKIINKLRNNELMALGYGLPIVKTENLFRFFKEENEVPVDKYLIENIFSKEWGCGCGKYKELSFPTLDFTQGIAENQDEWLKAIAEIVEKRRQVNTCYLDKGARFTFLGIDCELRNKIQNLGLEKVFTNNNQ